MACRRGPPGRGGRARSPPSGAASPGTGDVLPPRRRGGGREPGDRRGTAWTAARAGRPGAPGGVRRTVRRDDRPLGGDHHRGAGRLSGGGRAPAGGGQGGGGGG